MSSSFEKSVKGATKSKLAPPKSKYIEHILIATHSGEHGVAEVFRALQNRLRDSTWTVVFKGLVTVHLMIREGSPDVTLEFLARHKNMLAVSTFTDVQTQGRNIRHYASYLTERARGYKHCKCDFVRGAEHRFDKLTVEKGLLRETEMVQTQISSLLKCEVLEDDQENEITITVFRMLVLDLLALFHVINQAMINILGHFFEMSKSDADRAMEIYRTFTRQTDFVVGYLSTARSYEHKTRVEVPKLKHAPVNLGKQLEDYLADPDFDINRRQYLAEQEVKKYKKGGLKPFAAPPTSDSSPTRAAVGKAFPDANPAKAVATKPQSATPHGPAPDLIDFFGSIEQNQQPLSTAAPQQQINAPDYTGAPQFQPQQAPQQQPQQFQQNGFAPQQTGYQDPNQLQLQQQQQQQQFNNGLSQPQPQHLLQTNFTGADFGGFSPQPQQPYQQTSLSPITQNTPSSFPPQPLQNYQQTGQPQQQQQQATNPFRASMMLNHTAQPQGPMPPLPTGPSPPQNTNPFAKPASAPPIPAAQQYGQQPVASPLQAAQTGTNPFARGGRPGTSGGSGPLQQPQQQGLMPQPTGSTNPFRQSAFVNTATGQGWQNAQAPIGGGLDALETISVFPRPSQQQPWGQ